MAFTTCVHLRVNVRLPFGHPSASCSHFKPWPNGDANSRKFWSMNLRTNLRWVALSSAEAPLERVRTKRKWRKRARAGRWEEGKGGSPFPGSPFPISLPSVPRAIAFSFSPVPARFIFPSPQSSLFPSLCGEERLGGQTESQVHASKTQVTKSHACVVSKQRKLTLGGQTMKNLCLLSPFGQGFALD